MKTVKVPVIDRNAKTITATREFLIRAGQFGSTEFNILLDMQKNHPDYTVVEHKIKRNPNKNTYGALSYDKMNDFIKGYYQDKAKREDALIEFHIIKKTSKAMPAAYAYVKSWFLDKYKTEFDAYEKVLKAKEAERKANEDAILNGAAN